MISHGSWIHGHRVRCKSEWDTQRHQADRLMLSLLPVELLPRAAQAQVLSFCTFAEAGDLCIRMRQAMIWGHGVHRDQISCILLISFPHVTFLLMLSLKRGVGVGVGGDKVKSRKLVDEVCYGGDASPEPRVADIKFTVYSCLTQPRPVVVEVHVET